MHRPFRLASIAGLTLIAVAVATLVAWGFYTRETWDFHVGFADPERASQSYVGRGLRILMFHPLFVPLAIGAIAAVIAAGTLVLFMIRERRWAFLAAAIGTAVSIAVPWLARKEVWDVEAAAARSAKWAARSPYVTQATQLAIAATIALALVAIASAVAFATARRAQTAAS